MIPDFPFSEALFRTMVRSQRRGPSNNDQFFSASHFVHVRPMFEVAWMSFLAGLSGPLQETDDLEVVDLCLEGFKNAIRIVCLFDLELARNAFVTTLAKFTFLNNLGEMKTKNMEAIKTLLDIAVTEGNSLKGSWQEVLTCVSQLEHMQIITSGGVDGPDSARKGYDSKPLVYDANLTPTQKDAPITHRGISERKSIDTYYCCGRYGFLLESLSFWCTFV
jgi:brefeldin A-inhibited guanine nucleotide-exchange protein